MGLAMNLRDVEIAGIARRFRDCIEAVDPKLLPPSMMNFPRGSCGDSSLLIGAFLADRGYSGFEYVSGDRGTVVDNTWTSHAWLQRSSLVVDITADQFDDAPSPVIVSHNSVWHKTFDIDDKRSPADFRAYSGSGSVKLHPIYAAIRDAMDS